MFSNSSSWIEIFSYLAFFGGALVIVGVVAEAAELIVKWGRRKKLRKWVENIFGESRRRKIVVMVNFVRPRILPFETLGFSLLFVGLAIELAGSFTAEISQSRENTQLESTNQHIALQLSLSESNNLILRSNVAVLEAAAQWRTITPTQETNIIGFFNVQQVHLQNTNEIKVKAEISDVEAVWYANRLVNVLKKCGFNADAELGISFPGTNNPGPFIGLGFGVNSLISFTNFPTIFGTNDLIAEVPVNGTPHLLFRVFENSWILIPQKGNAGIVIAALVKNGVVPTTIESDSNLVNGDIIIAVGHKPP